MITSKTSYLGDLRTVSEHRNSGEKITSDAPADNYGKGEYFSPTDFLATSLAQCMITIMGINAKNNAIELLEVHAETEKIMTSNPRRVAEIVIALKLKISPDNNQNRKILEIAGRNCPVAKSLHSELKQTITFVFQ